jgi:carbon storage regulator
MNRTPGHSIRIGDSIRIVVLSCDRRGVRIGIEAPARIGIAKEEIVIEMAEENRRATGAVPRAAPSS